MKSDKIVTVMIFKKLFALGLMWILPLTVFSCELQRIEAMEAITCGVGTNLVEAKNDAIRQGIQYLVGSYVTSDLESTNENITKDNVTDYSGAIADRFEIVSQRQRNDGLYEMSAHIWITGDANRQRNKSPVQKPGKIDAQSLYAEAVSRIRQESDSQRLWENLLSGFPGNAFTFNVGRPTIETIQGDSKRVKFNFSTLILWRRDFLTDFYTLLKNTGQPIKIIKPETWRGYYDGETPKNNQSVICLKTGFEFPQSSLECYVINVSKDIIRNGLCLKQSRTAQTHVTFSSNPELQFENNRGAPVSPRTPVPYVVSDGIPEVFTFYLVNNELLQSRNDYLEHIKAEWRSTVLVENLSVLENISAIASMCEYSVITPIRH